MIYTLLMINITKFVYFFKLSSSFKFKFQVPRFWLVGYDEDGSPLVVDKMKEDFSQVEFNFLFNVY